MAADPVVLARRLPAHVIGTSQTRAVVVRGVFAAVLPLLFASGAAFGQTSASPALGGVSPSPGAPLVTTAPPLPWAGSAAQEAVVPVGTERLGLPNYVGNGPLLGGGHYLLRFNEDWCGTKLPSNASAVETLAAATKCISLGGLPDSYIVFSGLERLKPAYQKRSSLVSAGPVNETQVFVRNFRWSVAPNLQVTGAASYIVASQLLRQLGGRDLPNAFVAVTAFF